MKVRIPADCPDCGSGFDLVISDYEGERDEGTICEECGARLRLPLWVTLEAAE